MTPSRTWSKTHRYISCPDCGRLVAAMTADEETLAERRLRHAREDFSAAENIYKASQRCGEIPLEKRQEVARAVLSCALRVSEALKAVRAEEEAHSSEAGRWHG